MDLNEISDENLFSIISRCFINNKRIDKSEIFVIYENGARERIWTFNPVRYDFDHREFIGMSKIEAVFHCDRRKPRSIYLP